MYYVGGFVRNKILGIKAKDIDIVCTETAYPEMVKAIIEMGGTIFQERPQFLTVKARLPVVGCADFVVARKEGFYSDCRHPDKVEAGTLLEDMSRRDARMNAIAENIETGEIFDPFNGRKDIEDRIINSVGNPLERFSEDKLRVFRFFRFSCQLDFRLSPEVTDAIHSFSSLDFEGLKKEMIQIELLKAFSSNMFRMLELMKEFNFIQCVMERNGIWLKPTTESK